MPKISVIIPIYNAQEYLERCLNSVINQTLADIEIICVDDYSSDLSLEILEKYSKNDSRIKIINHNKNQGESSARNSGLNNASGEYVAFVDNDDEIDLNFLEKLYNNAHLNNADISKGEAHIIQLSGKDFYSKTNKQIKENDSILFFAYFWWSAIFKRELIEKNNIRFDEKYILGGDVLFLNEVILNSKSYALCNDVYYHYHKRINSTDSKILSIEKIKSVLEVHKKILENTNKYALKDKKGKAFIKYWCVNSAFNYAFRNKNFKLFVYSIKKAINFLFS